MLRQLGCGNDNLMQQSRNHVQQMFAFESSYTVIMFLQHIPFTLLCGLSKFRLEHDAVDGFTTFHRWPFAHADQN